MDAQTGSKTMKNETTKIETITKGNYRFDIYRAGRKWFANASISGDEGFIYKWTTGNTKKAVLYNIEGFTG